MSQVRILMIGLLGSADAADWACPTVLQEQGILDKYIYTNTYILDLWIAVL